MTALSPVLVDVYQPDGVKDWAALAAAGPPWSGVILKATEGTYYAPAWFGEQFAVVATACPERNGVDWFFGGYHYLRFDEDGETQADFSLKVYQSALWSAGSRRFDSPGALPVMVDVERASQKLGSLTKDNVEHVTASFAVKVAQITGRTPTLYGGELLYSLGITFHMGCGRLAIARYMATLPEVCVTRIGWTEAELLLWQYQGTDRTQSEHLAGYPTTAPGCGVVDLNVAVRGLESLRIP